MIEPPEDLNESTLRQKHAFDRLERQLRGERLSDAPPPALGEAPDLTPERIREIRLLSLQNGNLLSIYRLIGVSAADIKQLCDLAIERARGGSRRG